jgi:hypothetical protein
VRWSTFVPRWPARKSAARLTVTWAASAAACCMYHPRAGVLPRDKPYDLVQQVTIAVVLAVTHVPARQAHPAEAGQNIKRTAPVEADSVPRSDHSIGLNHCARGRDGIPRGGAGGRPDGRLELGQCHPLFGYQDADGLLDVPALGSFNGVPHACYNAGGCENSHLPRKRRRQGLGQRHFEHLLDMVDQDHLDLALPSSGRSLACSCR